MHDAADTPIDTPSVTRNMQIVIDVMDGTQAAREKVQPGLGADVAARFRHGAFRGPGHARDLKGFDPDQVEPARDGRAGLFGPVLAPVGLPGTQPGQGQPHAAAASRAPLGAGELAFQPPQPGPLPPGQAGNKQQFLGARSQPRVLGAGGGELPTLLHVTRRALPARVPVRVLLNREVPHIPGMGAVVPQHRLLGGRREQPVPGHTNTLSADTDISGEVMRRCLPGLKARVSTPRT